MSIGQIIVLTVVVGAFVVFAAVLGGVIIVPSSWGAGFVDPTANKPVCLPSGRTAQQLHQQPHKRAGRNRPTTACSALPNLS
jgi:hypothetical protein